MPTLRDSAVPLDPAAYRQITPVTTAPAVAPQNAPAQPAHLTRSAVMISSLPSIATTVDGITRQFYGAGNLPTRRLMLP